MTIHGFTGMTWRRKLSHPSRKSRPKKARQSRSNFKVMLTVFFYSKGVVLRVFFPLGSTINRFYYRKVFKRLRECVSRKRSEHWVVQWWMGLIARRCSCSFRHCYSCVAHRNWMAVLPQPPYSPDLAPGDFYRVPSIMSPLKRWRGDKTKITIVTK